MIEAHASCANCGARTTVNGYPELRGVSMWLDPPWRTVAHRGQQWAVCSDRCEAEVTSKQLDALYEKRSAQARWGNSSPNHDPDYTPDM